MPSSKLLYNRFGKRGAAYIIINIISVPIMLSSIIIREKAFREMKKDVGMTTTQNKKDGNGINLCSVYPANNPYIYVG